MGEVFGWISDFLERWSMFLLISTSLLPSKVWDYHAKQYRGFSRPDTYGFMLAMVPVGVIFARIKGESRGEVVITVVVGCMIMYLLPQIYAEIQHKRHYGVWLSQNPGNSAKPASDENENSS